jgi:hypothetical protein
LTGAPKKTHTWEPLPESEITLVVQARILKGIKIKLEFFFIH